MRRAAASATLTLPAPEDFSGLSWTRAFAKLHARISREYAFTQWKSVDWPAPYARYRPAIVKAQATGDEQAYYRPCAGTSWRCVTATRT